MCFDHTQKVKYEQRLKAIWESAKQSSGEKSIPVKEQKLEQMLQAGSPPGVVLVYKEASVAGEKSVRKKSDKWLIQKALSTFIHYLTFT